MFKNGPEEHFLQGTKTTVRFGGFGIQSCMKKPYNWGCRFIPQPVGSGVHIHKRKVLG